MKIKTENSIRILEHAAYYIRWDRFDGTPKTTRTLPLSKEELEALAILYSIISELRQLPVTNEVWELADAAMRQARGEQ